MLLTFLGCGFVLLRPAIPDYWIWMFWFSPLQYALTGMANNELLADSYDRIIPEVSPTEPLGRLVLETYGVNIGNKWRCVPMPSAASPRLHEPSNPSAADQVLNCLRSRMAAPGSRDRMRHATLI